VDRSGTPVPQNRGGALEKEFLLKTCVQDRFSLQKVLNESFRIDGAEGTPTVMTDSEGCLHWKEKIAYQMGEKNPYRILDRTVVGVGTLAGGLALKLAVDPWRDQVIDTRFQSIPEAPTFVPSVSALNIEYRYVGRRFEIDRHLQLSQTREYKITLTPRWRTPLAQANGNAQLVEIAEGEKFPLSVVFASAGAGTFAPLESRRFISRYETQVEVNAHHQIVAHIPMRIDFPEEPLLDAGLEIFLSLGPSSIVSSQQFEARKPAGSGSLTPESFSLDDLQAMLLPRDMALRNYAFGKSGQVMKPYLPWTKSPYELLTSALLKASPNLKVTEVKSLPRPPEKVGGDLTNTKELRTNVTMKSGKVISLPSFHPDEIAELRQSRTARDRLGMPKEPVWPGYAAREIEIIDELIEGTVTPPKVTDDTWQFTASFFHEASDFEREVKARHKVTSWEGGVMGFTSHSAEVSAGFNFLGNGAKYKGDVGVDARYGWWHRDQQATTTERDGIMVDKRNRVTLAEHRVLYSEERRFGFQAKVRKCLLLMPLAENKAVPQLYCIRELKRLKESWHYLADFDFRHDIPVERRDLRERMLIRLMRGRESYRRFKGVLQAAAREFHVRENSALTTGVNPLLEEALERRDSATSFFKDGGIFPGVVELNVEGADPEYAPDLESIER